MGSEKKYPGQYMGRYSGSDEFGGYGLIWGWGKIASWGIFDGGGGGEYDGYGEYLIVGGGQGRDYVATVEGYVAMELQNTSGGLKVRNLDLYLNPLSIIYSNFNMYRALHNHFLHLFCFGS